MQGRYPFPGFPLRQFPLSGYHKSPLSVAAGL